MKVHRPLLKVRDLVLNIWQLAIKKRSRRENWSGYWLLIILPCSCFLLNNHQWLIVNN